MVDVDVVDIDVGEILPIEPEAFAFASMEAVTDTIDGDMAWQSDQLTSAWPDLSEHTRASILMLIEADQIMRE